MSLVFKIAFVQIWAPRPVLSKESLKFQFYLLLPSWSLWKRNTLKLLHQYEYTISPQFGINKVPTVILL